MRYALTLLALSLLGSPAPAADEEPDAPPVKVVTVERKEPLTYQNDIDPILFDKCISCHSGAKKEGKLDLTSYEALIKGGKTGPAVHPGRSVDSLIVKLSGRTQKPMMPPPSKKQHKPLVPEELALLKMWIDQGAKAPTGAKIDSKPKPILKKLPDQVKPVMALAISPDKSTLAAGRGSEIHVYDAGTGNFVRALVNPELKDDKGVPMKVAHLDIVQSMAFSPDNRLLATGGFQEVILWDVQTGAINKKLTGFADRVVALDFSKDGKFLATGGGAPTENGEVKVFEVADGKMALEVANAHSDTCFGVRFSADGTKLATCAADKFVKVWELPSGKFLKSFEGHTHHVLDVGWKADGKLLASAGADNVIKIWNFETGEQARTVNNAHTKQVTRLLFVGATGQFITCSGDQTVKMWNVDNGGNVRNFGSNNDYLYAVGASPDGTIVAAGGQEGVVRLYNGANAQLVKTLTPPGETPEPKK